MVVVAGNIAIAVVGDGAGLTTKAVPNGWALSVYIGGTLNLKGAGGDTPNEVIGKIIKQGVVF